jgi:hypothetical protein
MKKTLIAAAIALTLGLSSTPGFAANYLVNGHAASAAELQYLVAKGAQPGKWVVNGFGFTRADGGDAQTSGATQTTTGGNTKKCWYVLDVQLCE